MQHTVISDFWLQACLGTRLCRVKSPRVWFLAAAAFAAAGRSGGSDSLQPRGRPVRHRLPESARALVR